MGRFLQRGLQGKVPVSFKGLRAFIVGVDHALSNMRVQGGTVVWSGQNVPTIVTGSLGEGSEALPAPLQEYHVLSATGDGAEGLEWRSDWVRFPVPEGDA